MITRPLDLEARLSPPPRSFDGLFWVNAGMVALFFTLLGSKFVLPYGVAVEIGGGKALPPGGGLVAPMSPRPTVVVSYRSDNVILFEDGIYTFVELRKPMERYIKAHPGSVVLLRMNAEASVRAFTEMSELARALGFAEVVLAAENQPSETPEQIAPLR